VYKEPLSVPAFPCAHYHALTPEEECVEDRHTRLAHGTTDFHQVTVPALHDQESTLPDASERWDTCPAATCLVDLYDVHDGGVRHDVSLTAEKCGVHSLPGILQIDYGRHH
jgi:hypothetical protein